MDQGRALAEVSGPIHAVDQQDVLPPVPVVVEKGAAGTQSFGEQLAAIGAVVVAKVKAGGAGYVGEMETRRAFGGWDKA